MYFLTGLTLCTVSLMAMGALRDECASNGDCPNTHCCVTDYHGKYCSPYQNASQPCHLPGHTFHTYHCNCAPVVSFRTSSTTFLPLISTLSIVLYF